MFDVVLAGHPVSRRGRLAAPAAVAVHVLVLGAVIAVSAWKIGDVPEPNVPVVFAAPASPPPAAGVPAGGKRPPGRQPSPSPAPAPPVLPASIPDVAPPVAISELPAASGDDAGPDPGTEGRPGGVPGGTGSGETGRDRPDEVLSERTPNVVAPRLLRQVAPEYPEPARRARLQGIVVLQAVIGIDGGVDDVRVLSSASPLFEEPAVRAVRQWRYSAATLDGRAVRVYLTATITFALH